MTRLLLNLLLAASLVAIFIAYLWMFLPPDWAIASAFVLMLLVLWLAGERRGGADCGILTRQDPALRNSRGVTTT